MRDAVATARPDLLDLACELVGSDPFEQAGDGTRFAQPAIYCAALAGYERLGRPPAACAAGHSLGELAALAAAGALDHHDGLRLAVERGALMQTAAERDGGGMVALLGDRDAALDLIETHGLTLANDNAPEQLVASGAPDAASGVPQGGARRRLACGAPAGRRRVPLARDAARGGWRSARRSPSSAFASRRSRSSRARAPESSTRRAPSSPTPSFGRSAGARRCAPSASAGSSASSRRGRAMS